jgi:hypothetical protein
MDGLEQQIGYLVAKMEEQGAAVRTMALKLDALEKRVDDKFKTAEGAFKVLKWTGALLLAVLTLPWASIKSFVLGLIR